MKPYKLLHIGDEHLSDLPPANRKPGYRDEILAKEAEIVKIAKDYNVDAIIRSGDIFHIKAPSRVSHGLVADVLTIWKDLKSICPNYLVIGNHDLQNDAIESLAKQPIRDLLVAEGAIAIPEGEDGILLREGSHPVRISAIYGYGTPDIGARERYRMERRSEDDILIKATHTALFPKGYKLPGGAQFSTLEDVKNHGADIYLSGHIHDYFGVQQLDNGVYASMPGALSRGSLPEVKANRTICVMLVTIAGRGKYQFEEIPIKSARPVKEVFTLPLEELKKLAEKENNSTLDKYIDFLKEATGDTINWSLKNDILHAANSGKLGKEASELLIQICDNTGVI